MANTNLKEAKAAKNDEFYTQFHDIEIEMNAYLEYDPDVFRGKTVLLPCDDPEWSNFTRYFAAKFDELGLKKLISTSYAPDSKKYKTPYQPSLFEKEAPQFDPSKAQWKGRYSSWNETKAGTDVSILMTSNGSIWMVTGISEAKKLPNFVMKRILSSPIRRSPSFVSSWLGLWKLGRSLL